MQNIEGIINEPTTNFVGKDGFFWWVGEVEDNEDPMELGRVKVRVLGYYTNVRGGTVSALPTDDLPWATVLQHTSQAGNDGQGESSGQLQPGAIVMGFFMDGENAQMPIVIGVLRVNKASDSRDLSTFVFTGEKLEPGTGVNPASLPVSNPTGTTFKRPGPNNNSVAIHGSKTTEPGGYASPKNPGTQPGINGSSGNPQKPRQPSKPIPAANGVGGPWKTLEYKLSYLIEDIADTAGTLVKTEDGDFLAILTGKIVTAQDLTEKVRNFLGAVFAQVVSAIRQTVANLADQLQLVTVLGGATGAPMVIFTIIQKAVTKILSSLCSIDSQIIDFVNDPLGALTDIIDEFLDGLIDKATAVVQGVQEVIDNIVCKVQDLLSQVMTLIDTVSDIVDGVDQAKEVISAWKEGNKLFGEGTDLFKQGIEGITGIIAYFLKFTGSGCNREPQSADESIGFFPLFGSTACSDEDLDALDKFRGKGRGSCGDSSDSGGLIDSIFDAADPYLTAAKTFVNGAYDLHIGTPGRQATLSKRENGSSHLSTRVSNSEYAEWSARRKLREDKPNASEEEIEKAVKKFKKKNAGDKEDSGTLVADHYSYAGNLTREIHGDYCTVTDGDYIHNVDGDYHLKVTGNCHIEVGGGFFFGAEGAPQSPKKGKNKKKGSQIQKHTIRFGSDVDMSVVGAKYEVQAAEINLASQSTKLTGSLFENSMTQQTMAGGELILSANNSVTINTVSLYELINVNGPSIAAKSGIFRTIRGSEHSILIPGSGGTDTVPIYMVKNEAGPIDFACAVQGMTVRCNTGAFNVNAVSGAITMNAALNTSIKAGLVHTTTAGTSITAKAPSIFLN